MRGDHVARAKPLDYEATTRALVAAEPPLRAMLTVTSRPTTPASSAAAGVLCVARAADSVFDETAHTYAETLGCLRGRGRASRSVLS